MVGLGRLERPTSPLSGVRSNHLSYRPSTIERVGFSMSRTASAIALSGEEEKRGRRLSRQWALTEPCILMIFDGSAEAGGIRSLGAEPKKESLERR